MPIESAVYMGLSLSPTYSYDMTICIRVSPRNLGKGDYHGMATVLAISIHLQQEHRDSAHTRAQGQQYELFYPPASNSDPLSAIMVRAASPLRSHRFNRNGMRWVLEIWVAGRE